MHGKRAVLNLSHPASEFEAATAAQKHILYPILKSLLNGSEKTLLDFGCGPGRFTPDLARLIGGTALGVDISEELIEMAPPGDDVSYQTIPCAELQLGDMRFDVVWICLVLGGIREPLLGEVARSIERVMNPGGLLLLIENTTPRKKDVPYWAYRSVQQYQAMFASIKLDEIAHYEDSGERMTIMAGRRDDG